MSLRKIQFNSVFNITKDIRRYIYDIEQYLKTTISNLSIIPSPSVPDEIEPDIPRFIVQGNIEKKIIKIEISQLRITFYLDGNNEVLSDNDFNEFVKLIKEIKSNIKPIIPNYNILYEGLIIIDEEIKKDITSINILPNFTNLNDELRTKEAKLIEDKYFMTTEKVVLKIFDPENQIASLSKNIDASSAGYLEVYVREINNRYLYNNNVNDDKINNELNIDEIKNIFKEEVQ